jgi:phosphatidylinositol-3-phosphatase
MYPNVRRAAGILAAVTSLVIATPTYARPIADGRTPTMNRKVVLVVEENRAYGEIIGSPEAPYLNRLARRFGSAGTMLANYPVQCPSLAAYIILTSGTASGICDDQGPRHHPLAGPNIFAQLDAAHLPWRTYAENLPAACARRNSADGVFLVRHTPVAYYTSEAQVCRSGEVELGRLTGGELHDDIAAGRLPAYSFITPNTCHDMHGAPGCPGHRIPSGDLWLSHWMPQLLSGPDYRAGRLVVIVTWDEGSTSSNHIPTLVISPGTRRLVSGQAFTHCSTLRTVEELLRLPLLGCAAGASSMRPAFAL